MFMKKVPEKQLSEVSSETGDMYKTLGHHGPAIENEFLAFRVYFNFKTAIDIYSKSQAGLELEKASWYTTPEQQLSGWGADYYKVGNTVGLGGLKLWDGEKVIDLNPVSDRSARVVKEGSTSFIEMTSKGIPYKGSKVDIVLKVTVFSGLREAKVEAIALSDVEVQFVTGLNYHKDIKTEWADNYLLTWGEHPEDVAAEKVAIGGALRFNPLDFEKTIDDGKQKLLISKKSKKLEWWISSANAKEKELNSFKTFKQYVIKSVPMKYTISNCVNTYKSEKSEKTEAGHKFWFADKNFANGKTLKLSVVEPGKATHPPHVHKQDEFFFILEGKAKFHLDGEEKIVGPNTSLYCPANIRHGISNVGDVELKYLVIKEY